MPDSDDTDQFDAEEIIQQRESTTTHNISNTVFGWDGVRYLVSSIVGAVLFILLYALAPDVFFGRFGVLWILVSPLFGPILFYAHRNGYI